MYDTTVIQLLYPPSQVGSSVVEGRPMTSMTEESEALVEALVMEHLQTAHTVMLDQMVEEMPALSWNQIFQTVDALSRRGVISLRRRGFNYELSPVQQNPMS
jgi:hypothetical protein